MDTSTILATIAIVTSIGGGIIGIINHSRIRSRCCGQKLEMSIDIDKTEISPSDLKIKIPERENIEKE